jgi:hypothetical protein
MLGESVQEVNKALFVRIGLNSQEMVVIKNFENFFYQSKNYEILLNFLQNQNKISLRVIDYFLTNYCQSNKVILQNLNVYQSYKTQLKNFHKKYFDPCSRGLRVPFFYDKEKCILTTICQLNFFKWFIENKIHLYVLENYNVIKKHMKTNKVNSSNYSSSNYQDNSNDNVVYCSSKNSLLVSFD